MTDEVTQAQSKRCIYCDQLKAIKEFTLEHVFPDSMGGNICSDFFKTRDVCGKCNSTMGLYVDGPFIKSFMNKNEESQAMAKFVDIKDPKSWVPFSYIGVNQSFSFGEGEICELWMGPFGELVYHIHDADDPRYDTYAGGNPIARKRNPGRAYLIQYTTDLDEIILAFRSYARQFKKAKRYSGNVVLQTEEMAAVGISPLPAELEAEMAMLFDSLAKKEEQHNQLIIQIGFEERFMAKLARGMGYKLFGEACLDSMVGKRNLEAMWEKDHAKRIALLAGTTLFGPSAHDLQRFTAIDGAYTVLIMITGHRCIMAVSLPTGRMFSILLADDPALWAGPKFKDYHDGVIHVIAPQIDTFIGPMWLPDFLAHKTGHIENIELAKLEKRRAAGGIPIRSAATTTQI